MSDTFYEALADANGHREEQFCLTFTNISSYFHFICATLAMVCSASFLEQRFSTDEAEYMYNTMCT